MLLNYLFESFQHAIRIFYKAKLTQIDFLSAEIVLNFLCDTRTIRKYFLLNQNIIIYFQLTEASILLFYEI